jgi:hypothetical protein
MVKILMNWLARRRDRANLKQLRRGFDFAASQLLYEIAAEHETKATPELIARVMEGHNTNSWFDCGMRTAVSKLADAIFPERELVEIPDFNTD